MKTVTPKNFILQLGSLITLYVSITSILVLIFSVTNLNFPDESSNNWMNHDTQQAIRTTIATLLVFFPTYIIFTRLNNQYRRLFTDGSYTTVAKWFVHISILGGILILLGDLVTLTNYFLNGEITIRFLVKVFALIVVVGIALCYYILDVRDYFKTRPQTAISFAIGGIIFIITLLIYGYTYIQTPMEAREIRLDEQQILDFQDIYWNIEEIYRDTQSLPKTIPSMYLNQQKPNAPKGRPAYIYTILNEQTFELCAVFVAESTRYQTPFIQPKTVPPINVQRWYQNDNWEHGVGETCFKRTIQPIAEPAR